jgi:glycosyltransferase involved in cell wall biosynthesis
MTAEHPQVTIVIPAYNEAKSIAHVLEKTLNLGLDCEIIVVDDGSKDGTADVVRQFDQVRLIRHPYNIGYGGAIKSGIRASRGSIILMMDADGQHSPADVERIVAPVRAGDYDMVVGARSRGSDTQIHRDIANALYNNLASYICEKKVEDLTSGLRAFRADIIRSFVGLLPNGFSLSTTTTLIFFRAGYRVRYEPIIVKRPADKSKVKLIRDGINFLIIILRIGVFFAPLRIFLPVATWLSIFGLAYGIYMLIARSQVSDLTVLLLLSAALTFLLGLVSEQIALLRMSQVESYLIIKPESKNE